MNGDPVEYMLSHFRQDSGWNYTMDARAVAISMDGTSKLESVQLLKQAIAEH